MTKKWYVIRTSEVADRASKQYIGTSALSEPEFLKALKDRDPIVLEDLTYVSIGGELKQYSEEWEPHPNRVILQSDHIISVVPLKEGWQEFKGSWDTSIVNKVENFLKGIQN